MTFARLQAGCKTLVDGAHALGSLPALDVPSLGATYYTANLHKWVCAPKGAAFLWAERGAQAGLRPPVVSHGYGQGFRTEFFWQGAPPGGVLALLAEMTDGRARATAVYVAWLIMLCALCLHDFAIARFVLRIRPAITPMLKVEARSESRFLSPLLRPQAPAISRRGSRCPLRWAPWPGWAAWKPWWRTTPRCCAAR